MSSMQLPNELWIHVFDDNLDILKPSDLCAVVRTSKTFRDLGLRTLYRRIFWTNPFDLIHTLEFWGRIRVADPSAAQLPKSLSIGVSRMSQSRQLNIVGLDGAATSQRPSSQRSFSEISDNTSVLVLRSGETAYDFTIDYFASAPLHHCMMNLASSFVNLEELVFTCVIIPQSFHTFVHGFPRLRKLRLEVCVLPATDGVVPNHTTLPITELSLLSLYYAVDLLQLQANQPQRNPMEFFSLVSAQSLITLHLDSTAPAFSIFGRKGSPPVPTTLRHIFLHRHRLTRIDKAWKAEEGLEGTRRNYDHTTIMLSMARFLCSCPAIESVSTCYPFSETHFTAQLVTPRYFDNSHLRNYSGPMASFSFSSFATAGSLQAIDVRDDRGLILQMIPKFGSDFPNLRVLSMFMGTRWDNEVIYAVCTLLPRLVRLKIVYSGKGPDDNFIIGLGPNFLLRLPLLHTFQFYEASGNPPLTSEEEDKEELMSEPGLKALILPWRTYCPSLREVQLVHGYLWRRADSGDAWFQRAVPAEVDSEKENWKLSVL